MEKLTYSDARACLCGSRPVWSKRRGGHILACPSVKCDLYLAISGPTMTDAVRCWNGAVKHYDSLRKGR